MMVKSRKCHVYHVMGLSVRCGFVSFAWLDSDAAQGVAPEADPGY